MASALVRLFQTLAFFEPFPFFRWLRRMFFNAPPPPQPPQPQANILFDFTQPNEALAQTWGALDDVVMGGVSASSFRLQDGTAQFSGNVSTANSGGFASVRSRNFEPALDLSRYSGITLQIKGDGQRYKLLLRDETQWDSVAYAYSFDTTASEWMTIRIPFTQMVPVFRAKTQPNSRPLNTAQIRSIQLMLSKFEYDGALNPNFEPGEFRMDVQAIGVY